MRWKVWSINFLFDFHGHLAGMHTLIQYLPVWFSETPSRGRTALHASQPLGNGLHWPPAASADLLHGRQVARAAGQTRSVKYNCCTSRLGGGGGGLQVWREAWTEYGLTVCQVCNYFTSSLAELSTGLVEGINRVYVMFSWCVRSLVAFCHSCLDHLVWIGCWFFKRWFCMERWCGMVE